MVMRGNKKTMSATAASLEQAIHGGIQQPGGWAASVERALRNVEQAVQQQDKGLESPEGGLVDVGSAQESSPGMERRIDHLHGDLKSFLAEVRNLRSSLRQVAEGASPGNVIEELRRRTGTLLEALKGYQQEEARLILETCTMDLGAGD